MAQIPTEEGLMDKDIVQFSASLQDKMRAFMRIPSAPIQNQIRKKSVYNNTVYVLKYANTV